MGYLRMLVALFLVSIFSSAKSNSIHENFLQCMSIKSSKIIHTPNSTSYSHIYKFSLQNLRWLNSTTPKPLLIITPHHISDIQSAVLCSRKHDLQIRVRSGGHDYEGLSYLCNSPFIIIDLVKMRSISVDLEHETAWVHSGTILGELYYRIAQKSGVHGFPAGICPTVGVGGHFSGGGFGTIMRKYGLAADHVSDAILVDVNGNILDRKSMGEDLFWAIRGGGGASFGIIISWKIKLVRVPPKVTVFSIDKRLEQGATKLVHRWQSIAHKFHEDLFIRIIIQDVGGGDNTKKTVQATFNSLFLGEIKKLIPLMNKSFPELGLQPENCTEMSWIESTLYFNGFQGDPLEILLDRNFTNKDYFKAKSDFVKVPISKKGLDGIWERFLEEDAIVIMILDPYGARMNEIPENELPFPHRKGNLYNIQYLVKWDVNGVGESNKHVHWMRKLYRHMKPYVSKSPRGAYLNYRDLDLGTNYNNNNNKSDTLAVNYSQAKVWDKKYFKNNFERLAYSQAKVWGKKYFKNNFERLALVKAKVDSDNFFRDEQSIPPLPASSW